jgi:hypothetical protein
MLYKQGIKHICEDKPVFQSQIPSALRALLSSQELEQSADIYAQQLALYQEYHKVCRQAFPTLLNENSDKN